MDNLNFYEAFWWYEVDSERNETTIIEDEGSKGDDLSGEINGTLFSCVMGWVL